MKNSHFRHLLELQLGLFCISTSGALGRYIELPPPLTIWWRALAALCFLGIYCWWKGFSFRFDTTKQARSIFIAGVLMAAHWISYFYALQLSNVAVGMLSLMTFPVMTTLLEPLLLKTKFEPIQLLLGTIVLIGIFFLVPSFSLDNSITQGALMGLLSAFVYSLRNILLKTQVSNFNSFTLVFYQMLVMVIVVSPVLFVYSSEGVARYAGQLLFLGLVTTTVGHSLFINSFRHFSVSTASIMSSMQPIYGILIAMLFLYEFPDARSIIGGALILVTVIIASSRK